MGVQGKLTSAGTRLPTSPPPQPLPPPPTPPTLNSPTMTKEQTRQTLQLRTREQFGETVIGGSCYKYNFCRDKKHVFSHDKSMLVATNIFLSRQSYKHSFVATSLLLSRQTRLLSRQRYACRNEYACRDLSAYQLNALPLGQTGSPSFLTSIPPSPSLPPPPHTLPAR